MSNAEPGRTEPVGWADVVTKHDRDEFADRILGELRVDLGKLETRLVRWSVGTMLATVGAVNLIWSI